MPPQNTPTQTGLQPHRTGLNEIHPNTNEPTQLQTVNNSTKEISKSSTHSKSLTEIITEANRFGIEAQPHQIALLQYHRDHPFKSIKDSRAKFNEVMTVIVQAYFGAANNTPLSVYAECFDRMNKDYAAISLEEVREAHAESSKNALKAFGGMYTVNMFGEIMHAWKQKRNKLLAAIDAIERNDEVKEAELTELKKVEFSKYCQDWLRLQQVNRTVKSYQELNLGICNELIQSGTVKGQRKDLWEKAKVEAVKQLEQERDEAMFNKGDYDKVKAYNSILQKIHEHNYPPDMKGRTEAIYSRLLVMDCIEANG